MMHKAHQGFDSECRGDVEITSGRVSVPDMSVTPADLGGQIAPRFDSYLATASFDATPHMTSEPGLVSALLR